MTYQTRSEDCGTQTHDTFELAMNAANHDNSIWKISFELPTGERIRLVRYTQNDKWILENIYD